MLQATVRECPNAVLELSIERVVPTSLRPSFSLHTQDGRNLTLSVGGISPSRVEPNSLGFLEVRYSGGQTGNICVGGSRAEPNSLGFLEETGNICVGGISPSRAETNSRAVTRKFEQRRQRNGASCTQHADP